ncbi:hypothetical protein [Flavobacterium hiemivividum]|uniref:Uncharacterized protein n=1 Tax=Flavobacterium hiemivividum TaxID=2541734 RepID=A0A4R5CYF8_9FLAO|nr:hypothetical protein [Flavobacterium hiemivividum]TDE03604.1 hypothetical protein E0F98_11050 [Flavobacterium hiemivividum]
MKAVLNRIDYTFVNPMELSLKFQRKLQEANVPLFLESGFAWFLICFPSPEAPRLDIGSLTHKTNFHRDLDFGHR